MPDFKCEKEVTNSLELYNYVINSKKNVAFLIHTLRRVVCTGLQTGSKITSQIPIQ